MITAPEALEAVSRRTTGADTGNVAVTVPARELLAMLKKIRIVGRMPAPFLNLTALRFQESGWLEATTFDYQTSLRITRGEATGETVHERLIAGNYVINTLTELVRGAAKDLDVTLKWEWKAKDSISLLTLEADGFEITVPSSLASASQTEEFGTIADWKNTPGQEQIAGAVVDVQAFRDLLDSVAHTASKDETLPVLTAINVVFSADRITAYATDRYRLARAWVPSPVSFEGSFLIKLSEWKRIRVLMDKPGDMQLLLMGSGGCSQFETVHFSGKDFVINALAVNGAYPKLRELFAKEYSSHMVFSAAAMKRASRVIGTTTERNQPFELTSTEDRTALRISTTWEENPAKSPLIPAEGEADVRTAFNPYFYQEALRALPGDKVRLSFATMAQPVRITSGLEPLDQVVLEQLVMPVRLPPKQDK